MSAEQVIIVLEDQLYRVRWLHDALAGTNIFVRHVATVADFRTALAAYERPALVILDHDLGGPSALTPNDENGENGRDAARAIPPHYKTPVIVWSINQSKPEKMIALMKAKGVYAVAMPFLDENLWTLKQLIVNHCASRQPVAEPTEGDTMEKTTEQATLTVMGGGETYTFKRLDDGRWLTPADDVITEADMMGHFNARDVVALQKRVRVLEDAANSALCEIVEGPDAAPRGWRDRAQDALLAALVPNGHSATKARELIRQAERSWTGEEHSVRPSDVRLELNDDTLEIEGIYIGDYTAISDGVVWGVFHRGEGIAGMDWIQPEDGGLETAINALMMAVENRLVAEEHEPRVAAKKRAWLQKRQSERRRVLDVLATAEPLSERFHDALVIWREIRGSR